MDDNNNNSNSKHNAKPIDGITPSVQPPQPPIKSKKTTSSQIKAALQLQQTRARTYTKLENEFRRLITEEVNDEQYMEVCQSSMLVFQSINTDVIAITQYFTNRNFNKVSNLLTALQSMEKRKLNLMVVMQQKILTVRPHTAAQTPSRDTATTTATKAQNQSHAQIETGAQSSQEVHSSHGHECRSSASHQLLRNVVQILKENELKQSNQSALSIHNSNNNNNNKKSNSNNSTSMHAKQITQKQNRQNVRNVQNVQNRNEPTQSQSPPRLIWRPRLYKEKREMAEIIEEINDLLAELKEIATNLLMPQTIKIRGNVIIIETDDDCKQQLITQ